MTLDNVHYTEPLNFQNLAINGKIESDIVIKNSTLKAINGQYIEFNKNVQFENCVIESISFHGIIINKLFSIKNCTISRFMDLSCSRFEPNEKHFIIQNNNFNNIVTFEDCNFKSSIKIIDNNFKKGTDLNTIKQLACYYPKDKSIITNNKGNLNLTESEEKELWKKINIA